MRSTPPLHTALSQGPLSSLQQIINRRLATSEYHKIIQKRSRKGASQGADPCTVEPVRVRDKLLAISQCKKSESRPKISARVQRCPRLICKGNAETSDNEPDNERVHAGTWRRVLVVAECEDRDGQGCSSKELRSKTLWLVTKLLMIARSRLV